MLDNLVFNKNKNVRQFKKVTSQIQLNITNNLNEELTMIFDNFKFC